MSATQPSGERQLRVTRELVVAKWGGELTRVGRAQAEDLGKRLRVAMYPGDEEGGLLRLHSTFRHDLKIYTSDEGRYVKRLAKYGGQYLTNYMWTGDRHDRHLNCNQLNLNYLQKKMSGHLSCIH